MKENVPVAPAATTTSDLPLGVQEALGELVGVAKDGLLALSVGVGLGVLTELMEEEVERSWPEGQALLVESITQMVAREATPSRAWIRARR